ncbi:hypothetical protein AQJ54_34075 [Streptomyces griseorubiginosus]|uniref:Integrase catalytic domain-containing protein n=1 Tax=Streptomyces griseorubiginosus TaxID=67304 RepID=A0A101RSY7_9ACTN|nr:hypothetical protein AQJ54_34075 [Streptomyces griseorubiginosus]
MNSDRPPKYEREPRGQVADAYESQMRALLREWPRIPAPVIADRIGWPYSLPPLRKRLALIRPEYVGIDPVDRATCEPGQVAQCDLWFPETKLQVGAGQQQVLPVLVMTLGFSRFMTAVMIPSRQAGDILSGMWSLIQGIGRVTKTLVWDREAAIGGTGKVTAPAAAFAGTLATQIKLAPPRDPEFKGLVLRPRRHRRLLGRPSGHRPVRRRHRLTGDRDRVLRGEGRRPPQQILGQAAGRHRPGHAATAAKMREALALDRQRRQAATRHHSDGHAVALRALPDYDALFGVDFNPPATKAR